MRERKDFFYIIAHVALHSCCNNTQFALLAGDCIMLLVIREHRGYGIGAGKTKGKSTQASAL